MTLPDRIEITQEYLEALQLLKNGSSSLLVTGRAGTGKSTLLRYYRDNCADRPVVLAPTGVAALTVEGQTIHSFFRFRPNITPDVIRMSTGWLPGRFRRLMKGLRTIVIDEASMLRADLLDCINVFLERHGPVPGVPFGGVRMVFFGDLYQLPPVVLNNERGLFDGKPNYESEYFFDAKVFNQDDGHPLRRIEVFNLTRIFRQLDNRFVTLLNRVREGVADKQDLMILNQRVTNYREFPKESFYVVLTGSNRAANKINLERLFAIAGKQRMWTSVAVTTGVCSKEHERAPHDLQFCVGAQVMMLTNDPDRDWVNGSLGIIVNVTGRDCADKVTIQIKDGPRVTVGLHTWENCRYDMVSSKIVSVPVGTYTQFPFRLCWAITIHKSQSKTFDRMAINLRRAFAYGQTYVALSRCTRLEGLDLYRPIEQHNVFCDPRISRFMDANNVAGVATE